MTDAPPRRPDHRPALHRGALHRARRGGSDRPAGGRIPWTRALAVSVAAFFIWLLLYAPTLQHNAQVSVVGTRRTVALDILGPLATVSRWSQLSHVVSISDGILGRQGNQPGNGSGLITVGPTHRGRPAPTTTTSPSSATTVPTPSTTAPPSAANPLRVLVVGDSLGIDLGDALVNDLAATGVVQATLDGKEATGLTRPDYFSWPTELQGDLTRINPQVVVVMIGANDPQDFPGPPDVPYGTAAWTATYTQRVDAFMHLATSTGAKLIWVGMPPMQDPGLSAKMATLDAVYSAEAAKAGALYLPSGPVIAPQGYTAYLDASGQEVNVREPDGTHIAPGGGELLSQAVIAAMRSQLGLHI